MARLLIIILAVYFYTVLPVSGDPIGHDYNKTEIDEILVDTGTTIPGTITTLDGLHDVPTKDAATDAQMRDVIGKKDDTAVGTVGTDKSVTAYTKGILTDTGTTIPATIVVVDDTLSKTLLEVREIEKHIHSIHRVFGKNEVQTATVFCDTTMGAWFYPYVFTAAADSTFGTAIQILGTDDTPIIAGNASFDLHEILITAVNDNTPYVLRVYWGATASAAEVAGNFSDTWLTGDDTNPQLANPTEVEISMPIVAVGTNVFIAISNAAGAQTLSGVFSIHGYPF